LALERDEPQAQSNSTHDPANKEANARDQISRRLRLGF
jgi:hypothetical protein